jgi:Flp pilus assembly protein CpaB
MTVKVDDVVGVSGFIMPGTLVDIVVVIQPPKGTANEEMISKIVCRTSRCSRAVQNIDKPKNDREVERSVRAVTLQVTPEQAEKLALASSEGKLQLVMRNSVDQADEQTSGANKRTCSAASAPCSFPSPESVQIQLPKQPQLHRAGLHRVRLLKNSSCAESYAAARSRTTNGRGNQGCKERNPGFPTVRGCRPNDHAEGIYSEFRFQGEPENVGSIF